MRPEIFMHDFKRTAWGDSHYAVVGRALSFASRFEKNAKSLSALIKLKSKASILGSEEEIEAFFAEINRTPLAKHLQFLGLDEGSAADILKDARLARNEVAHELALGMDRCLDLLPERAMATLLKIAENMGERLAKADAVISFLASVATSEPTPTREFFDAYPAKVVTWICEL